MGFASWYPAERCVGSARDGARALMRYVLDTFDGATNLGIYNCRNTRGTGTFSPHAEGRAIDAGFPLSKLGEGSDKGYALVYALIKAGPSKLGVQAIIYDRTIWSARSPGGRTYTGAHPHYDHVHVEMTRAAADKVTLATVRTVLEPEPAPTYESYSAAGPGNRTIGMFDTRPRSAGADVKELQRILNAWYPTLPALKLDGYFGPATKARVEYLQRRAGITVDGVVGKQTWAVLNVT
jgi:hypothetical protein